MKKRSGNLVIPVIMGIGITGGAGLLAFNDAPRLLQVPEPRTWNPAPPPAQAPQAEPERIVNDWPASIKETHQHQAPRPAAAPSEKPRQTDFNDRNYRPREAANIVQSVKPAPRSPEPQTAGITVIGLKESRKIKDYCPGREGSIERRNCKMAMDLNGR